MEHIQQQRYLFAQWKRHPPLCSKYLSIRTGRISIRFPNENQINVTEWIGYYVKERVKVYADNSYAPKA